MNKIIRFIVLVFFILSTLQVNSQYFGKNKVNYEEFDFKIYETPHFEIYHYLEDEEKLERFAQLSERWYLRHLAVFGDTFPKKNPMILYNNHADFQQTTVIQSMLGVGTGGVTEGMKTRVVMPISPSNKETNHVLGHEMVHVFQYNMVKMSDSAGLRNIGTVPLWMIEGLSEYLSIGSRDVKTAMWMRDAVKTNDIPTLKEMTKNPNKYFPYRYGHAFWVFITGHFGDGIIRPLLMRSARVGYKRAISGVLGYSTDSISTLWANALTAKYSPYERTTEESVGTVLFNKENAGRLNMAPAVSPDGKKIIFLSDKNVISINYFLADLEEGKIEREIADIKRFGHIDNYSYLESAGTWSPEGNQYALTTFSKGDNKLMIFNVENNKRILLKGFDQLDALNNPVWSPNGEHIVFTGLKNGQSDLYRYDIQSEKLTQLTNDDYSDLHPEFSPDGNTIVFISDRGPETDFENVTFSSYYLTTYNIESGDIDVLEIFPGANNTNPHFSPDGSSIYFVSDRDGFYNLYDYNIENESIFQLSRFYTGISGITELSPAIDVSPSGEIVYILYSDDNYTIYKAGLQELIRQEVESKDIDNSAADLPPVTNRQNMVVDKNLERYPTRMEEKFDFKPYQPKFSLEYVGSSGIGAGVSSYGTQMAGGVSLLFSDILKRNQLFTALRVQGEIIDIGGQVVYLNSNTQLNWGVSFSHIPYRYMNAYLVADTINLEEGQELPVNNLVYEEFRIFEDEVGIFGRYPLSKTLRFEGGISGTMYSYRIDSVNNYYSGGVRVGRNEQQVDAPESNYLARAYAAYVGDNSRFGLTSPLEGRRFRFQLDKTFGTRNYWGVLADYRKYFFVNPVSFAFRGMHYGRYGQTAERLYPMYIGYEYYVRGYNINSFRNNQCAGDNCLSSNQLQGNKLAVANAEIRMPFTGPKSIALIKSGFLFSDLVAFFDGGLAWRNYDNIELQWEPDGQHNSPVFSGGLAWRVNLFNAIIVEPYYAFPFQHTHVKGGKFGIYLSAGGF